MGMADAQGHRPAPPLAAIIGPPGPPGSGAPLRLEAPLAATWSFTHPMGRIPSVQVFLENGEAVLADCTATNSQITVTFSQPQRGFVLAF
jgi:hypothetical protein